LKKKRPYLPQQIFLHLIAGGSAGKLALADLNIFKVRGFDQRSSAKICGDYLPK
jgi:hypothetical protein